MTDAFPLPSGRDSANGPTWRMTIVILLVVLVVPPMLADVWLPYWEYADQDIILAYNALVMNDGLGQEFFDHTGYTYLLLLSGWYRLLHGLGLIGLDSFGQLPPLSDGAALNAAWTELIRAGRAFSLTLGALGVIGFTATVRQLTGNRWVVFAVGLGLVFSMGLGQQIRQMRTDFASGLFVMAALCLGLVAARVHAHAARRWDVAAALGLLALVGAAAALAMTSKVQGLLVLLGIPAVLVAAGGRAVTEPVVKPTARIALGWPAAAGLVGVAVLAVAVIGPTLIGAVGQSCPLYTYKDVGLPVTGGYQALFAAWIVMAVGAYAYVWKAPLSTAVAAGAALAAGMAAGLSVLWIAWAPCNAIAVANPIEHMFVFSSWLHGAVLGNQDHVLGAGLGHVLEQGVLRTLAIRTVILHPDRIPPTLLFEWWVIAGIVVAARRRLWRLALLSALLLGIAWGMEAVSSLRGFQRAYAIFTEPFVLMAAALLAAEFLPKASVGVRRLAVASLVVFLIAAQVWPVAYLMRKRPTVDLACSLSGSFYLARVAGFPDCPARP